MFVLTQEKKQQQIVSFYRVRIKQKKSFDQIENDYNIEQYIRI